MLNRQNIGKSLYNIIYSKNKYYRTKGNGAVSILMYHAIDNKDIENFHKQITWLSNRYEFITPDEFESFIKGEKQFNSLKLMISFDDGFKSSYLATTNVLDKFDIKTIFFVPTNFIGLSNWKKFVATSFFNNRLRVENITNSYLPMSWENVKELILNKHKIGAHSLTHTSFNSIMDKSKLYNEIYCPKSKLLEKLNIKIDSIAFPFGSINDINRDAIKIINQHYKYCYSGIRGTNLFSTNRLSIFRHAINPSDDPAYLGFIVEGGLNFIYYNNRSKLTKIIKK